jgi:hypothetical protein
MRKEKKSDTEPSSHKEIADIKNQYTNDAIFYTEPIEKEVDNEIVVEYFFAT